MSCAFLRLLWLRFDAARLVSIKSVFLRMALLRFDATMSAIENLALAEFSLTKVSLVELSLR
jgi:hypothetical protein